VNDILLSIAIPAYNRPEALIYSMERLIQQIEGKFEDAIEIVISDDHSPDNSLLPVYQLVEPYPFIRIIRHSRNIGLEANLIECTKTCTGKYLWIFGDDDFLEESDSLNTVVQYLKQSNHSFYILNRSRRNKTLSKCIHQNWMKLDPDSNQSFTGLREFCLREGFISIIGFITANIFDRRKYEAVSPDPYVGTMYPHLGRFLEAFHSEPCLLIGRPLICHRTPTSEEKALELGEKAEETRFMSSVEIRDAIYFSHPFTSMLNRLLDMGAFSPEDIVKIPERTVIQGKLIDFLINTVQSSSEKNLPPQSGNWDVTSNFFQRLPLRMDQKTSLNKCLEKETDNIPFMSNQHLCTISVITPSLNQGEFFGECLESVKRQNYPAIEHLVFDPGSEDNSRNIAESFKHVTLFTEDDEGQSDAINKGMLRSCGEIIAWINADDVYIDENVFRTVVKRFSCPDQPDIVYGNGIYIDAMGDKLRDAYINRCPETLPMRFQHEVGIMQPATFFHRRVLDKVGLLRTNRHYTMDYDYWIRCTKAGLKFVHVDTCFAKARYHLQNKTYGSRNKSYLEICDLMKEHYGYVHFLWLKRYAEYLSDNFDGVLRSSDLAKLKDEDVWKNHYRQLMRNYDADRLTLEYLRTSCGSDSVEKKKTLGNLQIEGVDCPTPCHEIPTGQTSEADCVCYTVGHRRWAFQKDWKKQQINRSHEFLHHRIKSRRNPTCVIVGNGPSLRLTDLSLLTGQDVIVSNNSFLSKELQCHATYYTVVNYLVAEQSSHHINQLKGVAKIIPYWLSYCLLPDDDTYYMDAVGYPEFSKDIFKNMSWRHTVTFYNLHLAFGLGYQKIVLVGFDHNYTQPKGIKEQEIIQSYEKDENHFHPAYFQGKKWQAADPLMMEEMYKLALQAYQEEGREILNATVGGALEVFPRKELQFALK
jgi:glycosyltransferase involved in cell wall biosynthesis